MTILYFTATGNSLYVAKEIGGTLVSIPQAIRNECYTFKDDKIGIIFPVYGGAPPQYIRQFLGRVQLESDYIFAVLSYGQFAGAAASSLIKLAASNNIDFSYINIIKMVDNYLPGFKMEDQESNVAKKQVEKHLESIVSDISSGKYWTHKDSFFNKVMTSLMSKMLPFSTGVGITKKYSVEDSCTKCGICAKVCPTNNIRVDNDKPVFDNNCLSCLSCTHNCPENAIRLAGERSHKRYRNGGISLQELIKSNR